MSTAIMCAGVASFNFVVNPYGYYPTRWFQPLVWSSRHVKVDLLRAQPGPEVLILGSSRSMLIPPTEVGRLAGGRAFNASVDSAQAEDWYALYGYVTGTRGARLKEIVLGIDLEAFHDHNEPDGRLMAEPALRAFLPTPMRYAWYARAAESLLSWPQTNDSARSVRLAATGYPPPLVRFDDEGLLHHVRQAPKGDSEFTTYDGRFAGFKELDVGRRLLFEDFLGAAQRESIRVRAFVTPLHPSLVEHLRKTRDFDRLHGLVVAYLHTLEPRFSTFSIVDFTDIDAFGGDPDKFLDLAHTDSENSRRMTVALWTMHAVQ